MTAVSSYFPDPAAAPGELLERVRARLAHDRSAATPDRVAAALRAEGGVVGDATVLDVVDALRRETCGAGPLDPLLADPAVTDVLVNGPTATFVDRGQGLEPVDLRFEDDAAVRRLAQRLAASAGRRLDDATPYVDVRLPDGTRLHAVLAPLARPGTCLSLRVPARRPFTLDDMVAAGAIPPEGAQLLEAVLAARLAFLVSGGTGTGKTTLLATLLSLVPPDQRLVVVEDSAELRPRHPHVVSLEARLANVEGVGQVSVRDLVRQALRMRPDRLVVGEARGSEVVDMLAAMNTGHEGGCGTVHANSAGDVPARLAALAIAAGLSREAAEAQMAAAVDVLLHLVRDSDGRRRLQQVAVLHRTDSGVDAVPAVTFRGEEVNTGPGARRLERLLHRHRADR